MKSNGQSEIRDRLGVPLRGSRIAAGLELLDRAVAAGAAGGRRTGQAEAPSPPLRLAFALVAPRRLAAGWHAPTRKLAVYGARLTGVLDNVLAGLLFAALYVASGRNLWLPILVHGVIDTSSVVILYFGFHP